MVWISISCYRIAADQRSVVKNYQHVFITGRCFRDMDRRAYLGLVAGGLTALSGCSDSNSQSSVELPDPMAVDSSNPIIYINDIPPDNFNGELALAMGSDSDGIDLQGYIHEFPPVPWWESASKYRETRDRLRDQHWHSHRLATESGFTNLPEPRAGLYDRHEMPESGSVPDTTPIGSPGTQSIIDAARDATTENPLAVAVGGPHCTLADAYLTEPSIREKVVVFCRMDQQVERWNAFLSGWSLTVVMRKLKTVLCPGQGAALIERPRVEESLPDEPLKEYMLNKVYTGTGENPLADGEKWAADAVSTLSPAHPDTRQQPRNLRFDGLKSHWALGRVLPSFSSTKTETSTLIIDQHNHPDMTDAWWSHMADQSTWGRA